MRSTPRSTRTDTPFPSTTLFRSGPPDRRPRAAARRLPAAVAGGDGRPPDPAADRPDGGHRSERRPRVVVAARRRLRTLGPAVRARGRSEEHTSELQSLMRISYAVFCLKKKKKTTDDKH